MNTKPRASLLLKFHVLRISSVIFCLSHRREEHSRCFLLLRLDAHCRRLIWIIWDAQCNYLWHLDRCQHKPTSYFSDKVQYLDVVQYHYPVLAHDPNGFHVPRLTAMTQHQLWDALDLLRHRWIGGAVQSRWTASVTDFHHSIRMSLCFIYLGFNRHHKVIYL